MAYDRITTSRLSGFSMSEELLLHFLQTAEDGRRVMSDFDAEAQAMASVNTSNKVLEDMFSAATGVLESYAMQRDRLKVSRHGRLHPLNL